MIQPVVVVSGSMTPEIAVGDLLVDRPVATADLAPGDVVSATNPQDGGFITHRVLRVDPAEDGQVGSSGIDASDPATAQLTLKGDANASEDPLPYPVGDEVWTPWLQIPGVGRLFILVQQPSVAIPLLAALVALCALSLLPPRSEDRA